MTLYRHQMTPSCPALMIQIKSRIFFSEIFCIVLTLKVKFLPKKKTSPATN